MIPHTCPSCATVKHLPEINDDPRVSPKIRLDELVQIAHHGLAMYRVMRLDGETIELEKLQ